MYVFYIRKLTTACELSFFLFLFFPLLLLLSPESSTEAARLLFEWKLSSNNVNCESSRLQFIHCARCVPAQERKGEMLRIVIGSSTVACGLAVEESVQVDLVWSW